MSFLPKDEKEKLDAMMQIRLSESMHQHLKELSNKTKIKVQVLIRQMIEYCLEEVRRQK